MKIFKKILKDGVGDTASVVEEAIVKKDAKPERKGKKRRRIIFKAMFVISIVSIMISVSYSWFTSSNKATIKGVVINVVDPKNLEAGNIDQYGTLDVVTGDGISFFKPEIKEVAIETEEGDDSGFITYKYDKASDYAQTNDNVTVPKADAVAENVRIIDFTLDMTGEAERIYLLPGTAIVPVEGSPAYLPGALRVAFLKLDSATGTYKPLLIWIPDVMSVIEGEPELESSYTFISNGDKGAQVSSLEVDAATGKIVKGEGENEITYVWGPIADGRNIEFDTFSGTGNYRCVIWLDGNDRECTTDLINQKFKVVLNISPGNEAANENN